MLKKKKKKKIKEIEYIVTHESTLWPRAFADSPAHRGIIARAMSGYMYTSLARPDVGYQYL